MQAAWEKQCIPEVWRRALSVFTPKEKDSREISQFQSIALLNIEGKIFFSILAQRLTNLLLENRYVNTSCQGAGIPGFPGCVEHSDVIWEQIQQAKCERSNLHVAWLDPVNMYGSATHQLIDYATEFYHMPINIRSLVSGYFKHLLMAFTLQEFTTRWQQLELGIAIGYSISPILFVAAFKVILIGARQTVEESDCHLDRHCLSGTGPISCPYSQSSWRKPV